MITQQQIQKELELMDSFFSDGEMKQHTKNYVLIRLSSILENGIKIAITKVLEEYKNKNINKSTKGYPIYLTYNDLKEISNQDKSIEEAYFENNQNLTNTNKINTAFQVFFNIKIFDILKFCLGNHTNYKKNIELFVKQRNSLIHQMTDTTFDKEKLLEFRNVVTNFLMDLQYFMHAFGELIEKDAREGELSDDEKMQLKKRFVEIKNYNS